MSSLGTFVRHLLHTLLPMDCASCGVALGNDPVPFFCRSCWREIRPLVGPGCPRCGRPFPSSFALRYSPTHRCSDCRHRRPSYTRAWSLYPYEGPLRDAICLYKYRGKVSLRDALVQLMVGHWPDVEPVDVVIPVPLHPTRLREREFNQVLLLADGLGRRVGAPVRPTMLVRSRETRPQAGLTRRERRLGLRRCFTVRRPETVAGKRILLIDDVFTTGTTVNECAKALRKAGSGDVYVVTLARTL